MSSGKNSANTAKSVKSNTADETSGKVKAVKRKADIFIEAASEHGKKFSQKKMEEFLKNRGIDLKDNIRELSVITRSGSSYRSKKADVASKGRKTKANAMPKTKKSDVQPKEKQTTKTEHRVKRSKKKSTKNELSSTAAPVLREDGMNPEETANAANLPEDIPGTSTISTSVENPAEVGIFSSANEGTEREATSNSNAERTEERGATNTEVPSDPDVVIIEDSGNPLDIAEGTADDCRIIAENPASSVASTNIGHPKERVVAEVSIHSPTKVSKRRRSIEKTEKPSSEPEAAMQKIKKRKLDSKPKETASKKIGEHAKARGREHARAKESMKQTKKVIKGRPKDSEKQKIRQSKKDAKIRNK